MSCLKVLHTNYFVNKCCCIWGQFSCYITRCHLCQFTYNIIYVLFESGEWKIDTCNWKTKL